MTIKYGMKLAEIENQIADIEKKRQKILDAYSEGDLSLQDMMARLKGLHLSLVELELQREEAKDEQKGFDMLHPQEG